MENAQKRKIVGVLIISIALLISLFFFWFFLFKEKKPLKPPLPEITHLQGKPDVPENCERIKDLTQREYCFDRKRLSDILYKEKRFEACFEIKTPGLQNECLFRIGRRKKDISDCLKIPDEKYRGLCVEDIAISQNNPQFCNYFKKEPYEFQECKDRVKAGNVGKLPQKIIPLDYCASIKTLEYGKLCLLNAMRAQKGIKGETKNLDFALTWNGMIKYREAKTKEDCQEIEHQGARKACFEKIKHPQYLYFDYDDDGIRDDQELWFGTDPSKKDTDKDGIKDFEEFNQGTNPVSPDTDEDGMSDGEEIKRNKNPKIPFE